MSKVINSLTNREGQTVPDAQFILRENEQWVKYSSQEIFGGKKVVVFALPGAYTPTCSTSHLPRYNQLARAFKVQGVDELICISVNDSFVMNAWAADQRADNIRFLADGNAEFTRGMGMNVDKQDLGFGERSWRYSMLVVDGVIEKMFIEDDVPGDPFKVSDADTMLNYMAPNAKLPERISLFTKPGCPYCARAKTMLNDAGLEYEVIELGSGGVTYNSLAAIAGAMTAPQVFVEGEKIGDSEALAVWLEQREK